MPKTNKTYWGAKLQNNKARFERTKEQLGHLGWHVVIVWECFTANFETLNTIIKKELNQ
jgi:DNA mismatch endonuclease, patch repair protein